MTGPYIVFAMSIFINKWTWPEQYRVQTLVYLVCVQIEKLIKCVIPNQIMLFCIMLFCCANMFWIKTVHFCLDFPLIIFFSIRHSLPLRSWQRSTKNQPKISQKFSYSDWGSRHQENNRRQYSAIHIFEPFTPPFFKCLLSL